MSDKTDPVTYWEKRCAILENALEETIKIIAQTNTAWQNDQFSQFFKDWDNSINTIEPEDSDDE